MHVTGQSGKDTPLGLLCFLFCPIEQSARTYLPQKIPVHIIVALHFHFSLLLSHVHVLTLCVSQMINDYFDLTCDMINDTSKVHAL